ncbi:MAG: plasmid recombination protein [Desulfovibrio sp.]|uniref:MobV family relaxase n=1 Tax=Desulfovibrio sp. TaxID=885 RepID=UPI00258423F5|nr:MobV family relaxase [Desulfovibrio sp.]MCD7982741.1 plasmid recombination protein [Desulfovibrio sp.]
MRVFTVLRIAKLKTWGAVAATDKHNARERETPNADEERSVENQILMGSVDSSVHDAIKEALVGQRIRKNAVLGVEMLISASPEYFRPGHPDKAGHYEPDRLEAWTTATTQWLQERYGDRIKRATLHLDEVTPHIHVVMVPLDDRGKLNCRALFGGSRQTLSELQTDYAQAVSHLGIQRGIANSCATHQKVSQYYTLTQADGQELPLPQTYSSPEMLSKVTRMSDERLAQYASQAATNGARAQRELVEPVVAAAKNEAALLKRENLNLKIANSRLSAEASTMKKQLEGLRGLDLDLVLRTLFKAKGPFAEKRSIESRYILSDRQEVFVSDSRWKIPEKKRGKGAIDLVMALRGYDQNDMPKAVGELISAFGTDRVTGEVAATAIEKANRLVRAATEKFSLKQAPQGQRHAR